MPSCRDSEEGTPANPSDELVTVFASRSHLANVEAEVIRSLLFSAGLRCWLARENVLQQPVGNVLVKVLASQASEARALLAEAAREVDRQ